MNCFIGKPGIVWYFLQGGWYRFLVDAKINEITFHAKRVIGDSDSDGEERMKKAILEILKSEYGAH